MNQQDKDRLVGECCIVSNETLLKNLEECVIQVRGEAARWNGGMDWWIAKKEIIHAEIIRRMELSGWL